MVKLKRIALGCTANCYSQFDQFRGVLKRRPDRTRIELTPRIVADQILDHFRQAGVTPQLSIIYLLLRSRNFIFGGSVMNLTIPADLHELKARFETWRINRKYVREPIPDELWKIAIGHPRLPRAQSRPNANIGQARIRLDSLCHAASPQGEAFSAINQQKQRL
jgi:hypothetical protein